jgi:hypothetical protein
MCAGLAAGPQVCHARVYFKMHCMFLSTGTEARYDSQIRYLTRRGKERKGEERSVDCSLKGSYSK